MQSAPAHIPAITVLSFGAGLADPDLILGSAYPAHDTRCSSSNTADSAANLCDTCTGSAFPN
jgi:hypothetical protein